MDVNAFAVAAAYDAHLPVGAAGVRALVRVTARDLAEPGVAVSLRLWTPLGSTIANLREVSPAIADLRERAIRLDDRTVEYPAGRWTDGAREYELAVGLPPRPAGDEMLAARFAVAAHGEVVGRAQIAVAWIPDERPVGPPAASADASTSVGAVAAADLPTGPSPCPRHLLPGEASAGEPCPGCGLPAEEGDRFCECCGHDLVDGRPR